MYMWMEEEHSGGMIWRDVDVVLDGLVRCGEIGMDHGRQFPGGIADDVDVVAVGWIGSIGFAWLDNKSVRMDVGGIGHQHLVHHRVWAVRIFSVSWSGRQMIDELDPEMVAGLQLENDTLVGGDGT